MLNRYKWTCSGRQRQPCGELRQEGAPLPEGKSSASVLFSALNAEMHLKKNSHQSAWDRQEDRRTGHIKQHIWAGVTQNWHSSTVWTLPLFVPAHFESKPLVYKTNCLVMQVSSEASPLNPGAKFNEPLDSWFCCFQIWGRSFWPVNHQLSALPSKI